ncbi:MAG TPA: hypothetical protein VK797_13960 [Tepidisphaeraceae bacterium]|jgi:hypothetical protein|nr:hypothetical protein [Tepidisphaeraceae bacterium]
MPTPMPIMPIPIARQAPSDFNKSDSVLNGFPEFRYCLGARLAHMRGQTSIDTPQEMGSETAVKESTKPVPSIIVRGSWA